MKNRMSLLFCTAAMIGAFSGTSQAGGYAFCDRALNDILEESDYTASAEKPVKISRDLFFANRDFFSRYPAANCTGAFRTLFLQENATGRTFQVYRSKDDSCDGGNTIGIILEPAVSKKAIAVLSDGDIMCN